MSPKILVFGPNGQVGYELLRTLAPLGEVVPIGRDRLNLDEVADAALLVRDERPALVLNAAAYTAVDKAESEPAAALTLNAALPGALAVACTEIGARLIHFSTDYVFDGTQTNPYRETDATNPLGVYGLTKHAGEQSVSEADPRHLVLRLAWVYGTRGRNFLLTMLRVAGEGKPLRVVADQYGAPSWSREIAEATALISHSLLRSDEPGGLYHLASAGQTTWHGFADAIFNYAGVEADLTPIPTEAYPTPAKRPAYSVLDSTALRERFGVGLSHWEEQLKRAIDSPSSFSRGN